MRPNKLRFRSGQVQLVKIKPGPSPIAAGDLVWQEGGLAMPASAFPFNVNLDTLYKSFAKVFLGIAHQESSGKLEISVDTSDKSVYEFDLIFPDTCRIGTRFGIAMERGVVHDQALAAVFHPDCMIARAMEYKENKASTLSVCFRSYLRN